jgi:type VI secretion system protein ImpF
MPSLLDRLLDDQPQVNSEPAVQRLSSFADYKASIVRDLETLVNTRQSLVARELHGSQYDLLHGTILTYGMPDFTSKGALNPEDRLQIQRQLETAIATGDRRFKAVKVQLLAQQAGQRMLTFRIDAVLRLHDVSRPVSFDAVLQVNTQQYQVKNLI